MNKSELIAALIKNPALKLYHSDCEWGVSKTSFHMSKAIQDFYILNGQFVDTTHLSTLSLGDIGALEEECQTDLQTQIETEYADYERRFETESSFLKMSLEEYTKIKTDQRAARVETLRRCNEAEWSITFSGS